MKHVRLHTPRNPQLSSGIICFEVDPMTPDATVARLLERRVVAPPRRLTPSPIYGERRASQLIGALTPDARFVTVLGVSEGPARRAELGVYRARELTIFLWISSGTSKKGD